MPDQLDDVDRGAMRRAIQWAARYQRSEGTIRPVPDHIPAEGSEAWIELATRCASLAQTINLKLSPWQAEPFATHDDADGIDASCYGRRQEEVLLRRKMIANNISLYEPDPLAALERASRERA